MKSKCILCLLAEGFEEIEVITPIDLLRRAGCKVAVVAVNGQREVSGRNGIVIVSDALLSEVSAVDSAGKPTFDLLFLPGGPGVSKLRENSHVRKLVAIYGKAADSWIAAICAAPVILADANLLANRRFTAHFSVRDEIPQALDEERVVVDGNLITSRGAGTAIDFGLALVRILVGAQKAEEIAASIMV